MGFSVMIRNTAGVKYNANRADPATPPDIPAASGIQKELPVSRIGTKPPIVVSVVATMCRVASTTISRWAITSSAIASGLALNKERTTIELLMAMPSRPRPPTMALVSEGQVEQPDTEEG